jgi:hypothetical protein
MQRWAPNHRDEAEWRAIRQIARAKRSTVADWVRHAIRAARQAEGPVKPARKLDALRAALRHRFPSGDIDQMQADIERGYSSDTSR